MKIDAVPYKMENFQVRLEYHCKADPGDLVFAFSGASDSPVQFVIGTTLDDFTISGKYLAPKDASSMPGLIGAVEGKVAVAKDGGATVGTALAFAFDTVRRCRLRDTMLTLG